MPIVGIKLSLSSFSSPTKIPFRLNSWSSNRDYKESGSSVNFALNKYPP